MKTIVCYNISKLEKALPSSYKLRRISYNEKLEDWSKTRDALYFVHNDVERVTVRGGFWDTMIIYLNNGETHKALSDNVNVNDKEVLRINSNKFICPELKFNNDGYAEVTDKLTDWLLARGISKEILDSFIETYTVYDRITYYGVPTPSKTFSGFWGYSNTDLELDEREIQDVLENIDNELLREKINCILSARIFKRK